MLVISCFEDMQGRVGLKRVWEFGPKVGEKKRNEGNARGGYKPTPRTDRS